MSEELEKYTLLNYPLDKYHYYLIEDYDLLEKDHIYLMIDYVYDYQIPVVITEIDRFDRNYVFDHIYGDEIREGAPLPPDYYNFPITLGINQLYSEDFNENGIKLYDLDAMYRDYLNSMSKLPIVHDVFPIIGEYTGDHDLYHLPKVRKRIPGGKKNKKTKRSKKIKRSKKTKRYIK